MSRFVAHVEIRFDADSLKDERRRYVLVARAFMLKDRGEGEQSRPPRAERCGRLRERETFPPAGQCRQERRLCRSGAGRLSDSEGEPAAPPRNRYELLQVLVAVLDH